MAFHELCIVFAAIINLAIVSGSEEVLSRHKRYGEFHVMQVIGPVLGVTMFVVSMVVMCCIACVKYHRRMRNQDSAVMHGNSLTPYNAPCAVQSYGGPEGTGCTTGPYQPGQYPYPAPGKRPYEQVEQPYGQQPYGQQPYGQQPYRQQPPYGQPQHHPVGQALPYLAGGPPQPYSEPMSHPPQYQSDPYKTDMTGMTGAPPPSYESIQRSRDIYPSALPQ